jgi:hypothetical protein
MRIQVLPYVTVDIDDQWRRRLRFAGEQVRINVTAYLRSAGDDVDAAGAKARGWCDAAVNRVNSVAAAVDDKIAAPRPAPEPRQKVG